MTEMYYGYVYSLVAGIGESDEWAGVLAPHGSKHKLSDGSTVYINEEAGDTYVHICLDRQWGSFRIEGEAQTLLEDYL